MAIFINREMKFYDLSDDLKLMVVRYFNLEDKMKLVDIFPPVIKLIKTFDMDACYDVGHELLSEARPSGHRLIIKQFASNYFKQGVELFNKLPKVTKIILPYKRTEKVDGFSHLRDAVFSGQNLNLRTFSKKYGKEVTAADISFVLKYIKHVKKQNPKYDASCLTFVFDANDEKVVKLISKHKDLLLKLHHVRGPVIPVDEDTAIRMIKKLTVSYKNMIDQLPSKLVLESVTDLIVRYNYHELAIGDLRKVLKCAPNVSKLFLAVSISDFNNQQLFDCLTPLVKLKELKIELRLKSNEPTWTESKIEDSRELVRMLITADRWPALKDLEVKCSHNAMTLSIRHERASLEYIELDVEPLVNRFSRLKRVHVSTSNREYADQVVADIVMLRKKIRNRYLTVRTY